MATVPTPRLGLLQYDAGTDQWPGRDAHNAERVLLDSTITRFDQGTFATRPAAGTAGRLYFANNTGDWYLDTGTVWVQIAIGLITDYLNRTAGGAISGPITTTSTINMSDQQLIRPQLRDYAETVTALGNSSTAKTLDCTTANVFTLTLTANCTLTFSNPPASGQAGTITLIVTQDATGNRTITWPAAVDWPEGAVPDYSKTGNSVSIFTFLTTTGTSRWYGFMGGTAFS